MRKFVHSLSLMQIWHSLRMTYLQLYYRSLGQVNFGLDHAQFRNSNLFAPYARINLVLIAFDLHQLTSFVVLDHKKIPKSKDLGTKIPRYHPNYKINSCHLISLTSTRNTLLISGIMLKGDIHKVLYNNLSPNDYLSRIFKLCYCPSLCIYLY